MGKALTKRCKQCGKNVPRFNDYEAVRAENIFLRKLVAEMEQTVLKRNRLLTKIVSKFPQAVRFIRL